MVISVFVEKARGRI